jgi:hypothetical protein
LVTWRWQDIFQSFQKNGFSLEHLFFLLPVFLLFHLVLVLRYMDGTLHWLLGQYRDPQSAFEAFSIYQDLTEK